MLPDCYSAVSKPPANAQQNLTRSAVCQLRGSVVPGLDSALSKASAGTQRCLNTALKDNTTPVLGSRQGRQHTATALPQHQQRPPRHAHTHNTNTTSKKCFLAAIRSGLAMEPALTLSAPQHGYFHPQGRPCPARQPGVAAGRHWWRGSTLRAPSCH